MALLPMFVATRIQWMSVLALIAVAGTYIVLSFKVFSLAPASTGGYDQTLAQSYLHMIPKVILATSNSDYLLNGSKKLIMRTTSLLHSTSIVTSAETVVPGTSSRKLSFNICPSELRKPLAHEISGSQIAISVESIGMVYLYSTHYDDRHNSVMLILDAVRQTDGPHYCQLWCNGSADPYISPATLHTIVHPGGNTAARYNYIFTCASWDADVTTEMPYAVGLVFSSSEPCVQPAAIAKVWYSAGAANITEFGVCVSPFSKNYSDITRLIEFIEVNRMFGAQKFVFFNYSSSPSIVPVLQSYIQDGIVDVIQFPLYEDAQNILPYFAQQAAFCDCFYRYLNSVKYFAVIDLDEFIVPRLGGRVASWGDMVKESGPSVGLLIIRNTFYKLEWPDAGPYAANGTASLVQRGLPQLQTLLKVWREKLVWRHGERSKYIALTRAVSHPMVHTASLLPNGPATITQLVHEDVALLHHYRDWQDIDDTDAMQRKGMVDDYLLRYADAIITRVTNRLDKLR